MSAGLIWFLIGVGFLLAELALPGFILIFFCLGSWTVALALLVFSSIGSATQIGIFLVFSLISLFSLRAFFLRTFRGKFTDQAEDGLLQSDIGQQAVVTGAIRPHLPGEIKFRGSFWRAVADVDIAAGQPVVIEGRASDSGLVYKVKPTADS